MTAAKSTFYFNSQFLRLASMFTHTHMAFGDHTAGAGGVARLFLVPIRERTEEGRAEASF